MWDTSDRRVFEALADSWDRNNTILVNLLHALPDGALELKATPDSPSVGALFVHMHYCRLVFVQEDAPEFARPTPAGEWRSERNRATLAGMLHESAAAVRDAVKGRLVAGRAMDTHYDHPILMFQHLVWHEGYHHGQIKLAGQAFDDEEIGRLTWDVWMEKTR